MAKRKRMRLPNGFGSIVKLSGKRRRRPYMARKTEGFDPKTGYPIYKILGYFETYGEAYEYLSDYNRRPEETLARKMTFSEVYEAWMKEYTTTPIKGRLPSESTIKHHDTAYRIHARPLHDVPISEITAVRIQEVVTACSGGLAVQRHLKALFSQVSKFAVRAGLIQSNPTQLVRVTKSEEVRRNPFTPEEVRDIWRMPQSKARDFTLILLYTGMRAGELCDPDLDISHLSEGYLIGGLKTDAGRGRIIPIHSEIKKVAHDFFSTTRSAYETYHEKFKKFFPGHVTHDCRRTFISQAQVCGMDSVASHKITGHVMKDIHYDIYTQLPLSYLQSEIEKLTY